MSRRAIYLALGALLTGFYLAPGPLHHSAVPLALAGLLTVAATIYAIVRFRPAAPLAWGLLTGGLIAMFAGDLMASGSLVQDLFYLAFYPLTLAGLVVLLRHRTKGSNTSALIDGLILTVGLALPGWITLVAPYLHGSAAAFDPVAHIAYPICDLLLLGGIVQLALGGGRRGPALRLLVASIGLLLAGDVASGVVLLDGGIDDADWINLMYLAAYLLWGAGVLDPSMRTLATPAGPAGDVLLTRTRLTLLTLASLAAPVLDGILDVRDGDWDYALVQLCFIGLFGLVVMRMSGLARRERALSAELHQRRGEERFAALVRHSTDLLMVLEPHGGISYASPSVGRILGPKPVASFLVPDDIDRVRAAIAAATAGDEGAPFECALVDVNGERRDFEVQLTNLIDEEHVGGILVNARDITERKAFEDKLTHQAFHDPVTGLANRELFTDRLRQAIAHARRTNGSLAVLFLDLDDFKLVNDSLGHAVGDEILVEVARRIDGAMRGVDTAARFGGDEFAVLLEDVDTAARFGGDEFAVLLEDVDSYAAATAAARILEVLAAPASSGGRELSLRASLGVSVATGADPRSAEDLLRDADAAMYHAKRDGHGGYRLFEPAMHADVLARLELRTDLQRAIDAGELELHYQPVVQLVDGQIAGFEALMRWRHPERGLVSPADFIPIAEETGLIVPMGRWALHEAADHLRALGGDYRMNVNLSAKQLQDPGLVDDVREAIDGLAPERFVLELTESIVMADIDDAVERLNALKALGVRLALDDFGTGYSSLGYLSRMPVDVLKLDRTFLAEDEPNVIAAVVNLGQALALDVVAEGIEVEEQWRALWALGCHYGQGFLFSKPLSAADSLAAVR